MLPKAIVTSMRDFNANLSLPKAIVTSIKFQGFYANLNSLGVLSGIRWYIGVFKQISIGALRATSRAINNMNTQNRKF